MSKVTVYCSLVAKVFSLSTTNIAYFFVFWLLKKLLSSFSTINVDALRGIMLASSPPGIFRDRGKQEKSFNHI